MDVAQAIVEVTSGRRSAGQLFISLHGEKGLMVEAFGPVRDGSVAQDPDLWLGEEYGSDVEGYCLWLACDLERVAFDPLYEEVLSLRKQNRRAIRETLAARHGWDCHICGRPIPRRLRNAEYSLRRPEPMFPDIEHVIPRRSGGLHFYGNLRLAHRRCNLRKGATDKPPSLRRLITAALAPGDGCNSR